jgi:hypothetical protein
MKPIFPIMAFAILLSAGAALADDDDCRVPVDRWQPHEAVMKLAETKGWTVSDFEIDDGCYEIEGRDKDGRRFVAKLDPETLVVVEMEGRREKGKHSATNPAPVVRMAPPANGLFGTGAPPVVVNQ